MRAVKIGFACTQRLVCVGLGTRNYANYEPGDEAVHTWYGALKYTCTCTLHLHTQCTYTCIYMHCSVVHVCVRENFACFDCTSPPKIEELSCIMHGTDGVIHKCTCKEKCPLLTTFPGMWSDIPTPPSPHHTPFFLSCF